MKRTYLDPIHQDIVLDGNKPAERLIIDLIDTQEFQRLRRVHQLGVSYFTFQGAEASRFTHCVGVMYVTSRLLDILSEQNPKVEEKRALISASALLHDLGHGPFSHVTEKILHYDHEDWSCKIISGDTEVNKVLNAHDKKLAGDIVKLLKKTYTPHWASHIISSQLDCDRFDYLLRDSYMTGTAYGLFALKRILRSLEIDEEQDRIIVVGDKGQTAVEDYLFARYSMYAQVYYHKKNLAARALLAKMIKRARYLLENKKELASLDEPTRKWLMGEQLSVDEYLFLDDVTLTYHIKKWLTDKDPILAELASRFLHRRIFKASRITVKSGAHASVEEEARKIAKAQGFDPDYYISIESTGIRPYDYYRPDDDHPQTNIMVRTDDGEVAELSKLSLAIEALVKGNYESRWLIYPLELTEPMSRIKDLVHAR